MAPKRTLNRGFISKLACVGLLLPACEYRVVSSCEPCKKTVTDADDAAIVDISDVRSSGVLQARLTANTRPLPGREIDFRVRMKTGDWRFVGEATTDANGIARLDLKESPVDLAEGALGDSYRARFAGDGRYCASRDHADLSLAEPRI